MPEDPCSADAVPAWLIATSRSPVRVALLLVGALGCALIIAGTGSAEGKLSKPKQLRGAWDGSAVVLQWKKVPGARAYRVKRCRIRNRRCTGDPRRIAVERLPRAGAKPRKVISFRDANAPAGRILGYRVWALGKKNKNGKRKVGKRSRLVRVRTPRPAPGSPGAPPGGGSKSAPPVKCDSEAAGGALAAAVASAPAGSTICVPGGSYPALTLSAARSGDVRVAAKPGATVTFADLNFSKSASHITLQGLHINGEVNLAEEGAHHIAVTWSWIVGGVSVNWGCHDVLVEHNDIRSPTGNGVELISQQPSPGAPGGSGVNPLAPVERVTIRGNKLHDIGTDGIFMGNYRDILVEDNEISGLNENGQHTDALQSVFGGSRLTFRGNYVHDNRGEGFFVKDGQAKDLVVEDNLFVHTRDLWQISFYNSIPDQTPYGARIVRNTVWDSNLPINVLGTENRSVYIHNNVFNNMYVEVSSARAHINQSQNVIPGVGRRPGDVAGPAGFRNSGAGDYRLASPPFPAGVTWAVSDKLFGP